MSRILILRSIITLLSSLLFVSSVLAADDSSVIAIKIPTGTHPLLPPIAFHDALITDLIETYGKACGGRITEWAKRAEALKEIELTNSRYGDPATAIRKGQALQPDFFIESTISGTEKQFTYSLQVKDATTGEVVAEEGETIPSVQVFDAIDRLANRLPEKLCKNRAGYRMNGVMDEATINGTICGKLDKPFVATSPEVVGSWKFVPKGPASGSFTYTAKNIGGATGSGAGTYVIARNRDGGEEIKLSGTGSVHSPLGTFSAAITESIHLTPVKTCGRIGDK
jgi:hypothetical protein